MPQAQRDQVKSDENKVFSSIEIRSHNTEGTLWLVLDGQVYDLSAFDHPGGY